MQTYSYSKISYNLPLMTSEKTRLYKNETKQQRMWKSRWSMPHWRHSLRNMHCKKYCRFNL